VQANQISAGAQNARTILARDTEKIWCSAGSAWARKAGSIWAQDTKKISPDTRGIEEVECLGAKHEKIHAAQCMHAMAVGSWALREEVHNLCVLARAKRGSGKGLAR
jgi:hypothetical protein